MVFCCHLRHKYYQIVCIYTVIFFFFELYVQVFFLSHIMHSIFPSLLPYYQTPNPNGLSCAELRESIRLGDVKH